VLMNKRYRTLRSEVELRDLRRRIERD